MSAYRHKSLSSYADSLPPYLSILADTCLFVTPHRHATGLGLLCVTASWIFLWALADCSTSMAWINGCRFKYTYLHSLSIRWPLSMGFLYWVCSSHRCPSMSVREDYVLQATPLFQNVCSRRSVRSRPRELTGGVRPTLGKISNCFPSNTPVRKERKTSFKTCFLLSLNPLSVKLQQLTQTIQLSSLAKPALFFVPFSPSVS